MRQIVTTCLVIALTVPAMSQNWLAICPMQTAPRVPTAEMAKIVPSHCRTMTTTATQSALVQCIVLHACCKVSPDETQFPMRYSRLVLTHSDLVVTVSLVGPPSLLATDLHLSMHKLLTRPPVGQLKTDLRI